MTEHLSIAFDEENNIRVLEAEKYRESDQLKSVSMEFITKVCHSSFRLSPWTRT